MIGYLVLVLMSVLLIYTMYELGVLKEKVEELEYEIRVNEIKIDWLERGMENE